MRQRMEKGKAGIEDLLCLMLEGFDLAAGALSLFLELQRVRLLERDDNFVLTLARECV